MGHQPDPASGALWRALSGLIAENVTSTMVSQGVTMTPPALWASWASNAESTIGTSVMRIGFSTAGGLEELDDLMRLSISPAEADRKIVIALNGFSHKTRKLPDVDDVYVRTYNIGVQGMWFETPSRRRCDSVSDNGALFTAANKELVYQTLRTQDLSVAPSPDTLSNFAWIAILDALKTVKID